MKCTVFNEFDEYAAAIEHANLRCTLPSLQRRYWSTLHLQSGPVHIQIGVEGSGNIGEGGTTRDGTVLYFDTEGPGSTVNGSHLEPDCVFLMDPGAEFCIANRHAHSWCSILIPNELMPAVPLGGARILRSETEMVRDLRSLVGGLVSSAAVDASVLTKPASRNAFQSSLGRIVRRLLAAPQEEFPKDRGRPTMDRRGLIRRALELTENSSDLSLPVEELATAAGVSDRTLRTAFVEFFGVPPKSYLQLRRLHRARAALRGADSGSTSVGAVAAKFGFWDFGRFASRYRRLFGELPSETLRSA
jgi:AraC family ethanolamine operon transcriptional activator